MRQAALFATLALSGCSLLFSEASEAVDAGPIVPIPDACVVPPNNPNEYPDVPADSYFVGGVSGDDTNDGSDSENAWGTLAYALAQPELVAGSTLVIRSGTYSAPLDVSISGSRDQPITIMAEVNGGTVFDGANSSIPCRISGSYVSLIGVQCNDSSGSAVDVVGESQGVTLQMITARGAAAGSPTLRIDKSNDALVEDVALLGSNQSQVSISTSRGVEVRRLFAVSSSTDSQNYIVQTLDCESCLLQNMVIRGTSSANTNGILIGRSTEASLSADNTQLLASLIYRVKGWALVTRGVDHTVRDNAVRHLVVAESPRGIFQRTGTGFSVENTNLVSLGTANISIGHEGTTNPAEKDADFAIDLELVNSIIVGGDNAISVGAQNFIKAIASQFNDLYNMPTAYSGVAGIELTTDGNLDLDPEFDTANYGLGAYLVQPTALQAKGLDGANIGAEVLYRYQNGAPTTRPLWPWPMDGRIERDLGSYRVTFAIFGDDDSGIWETLEGVYPSSCP